MDLGHGYLRQEPPTGRARRVGLLLGGLALLLVGAAVAAAILLAGPDSAVRAASHAAPQHASRHASSAPAFVKEQLGARRAAKPSAITSGGFRVSVAGGSVSLSSTDGGTGRWASYAGGAARKTPYGREFVTLAGSGAEQLLQVDRRQGSHTWRWQLDTPGLTPSLRSDGAVALLGADGQDTGTRIAPVKLLDRRGASVTPKGLHWSLASHGSARFLELRLDDASLPVPYLIDPAVAIPINFVPTSMVAGATADWAVSFTTSASGALVAGNTITVTFPNVAGHLNFTSPASPTIVLGLGFTNCSATGSGGANIVTVTLANSGGACAVANGAGVTLTIQGLQNPTKGGATNTINKTTFTILTTKDTVNNWAASGAGTVFFTIGPAVKLLLIATGQVADPGSLTNGLTALSVPTKVAAAAGDGVTIQAVDAYWNKVTTSTDTLSITSSDPAAGPSPTFTPTLVAGQWAGGIILNTPALPGQTVSVTDTTTPALTGYTSVQIPVYAAANSGTMAVNKPNVSTGATDTLTFTYTAATGGLSGGAVRLVAPANWTVPSNGNTSISFSGSGTGTLGYSAAQRIDVTALTMSGGETLTITYGAVTVPAIGTLAPWTTTEFSVTGGGPLVAIASGSPSVTVKAANGSGTISSSISLVTAGSTTNTLVLTYTSAATGGVAGGSVVIAIPVGWGAPQTASNTSPNYTTASGGTGSNTISWSSGMRTLTISNVTLAVSTALTVTYGNTSGGANPLAAAVAGTAAGTGTFTTQENSSGTMPLVALGVSPSVTVAAGAASDFVLSGTPGSLTAGSTGDVTVKAIDGYGNTDTGFIGTVTFSSNDAQAVLPADYTFTVGDAGVHAFPSSYTLKTAGVRTVTATAGSVTGTSAGITVNSALPATTMTATAPSPATAGTGFSVTVTVKDAYGNIATGYTGTVSLTSTDSQAVLPGPYTFVAGDNGSHAIPVTLKTVGSQTESASDGTLNANTGGVTVNPGPTSTLALSGTPGSVTAGSTGSVTVTAKDAYGNTTPAYTGTVTFTSSDGAWVAPANYTFTGPNAGVHTFTNAYTLKTTGSQTVTATDTPTSSITGTSGSITVNAAAPSLALSTIAAAPGSITANGTSTSAVTVQLKDAFGNNLAASGGTVALSATKGSLSAVTDNANGTYTATLTSSTTASTSSITGTLNAAALAGSAMVTFAPGPTTTFVASAPATATAGTGFSVSVTAEDGFGNTTPAYTGTVNLTSTDAQVPAPGSHTFTGGDAGAYSFPVTLKTAGSRTVTASDGSSTGTTGAIAVSPAATTVLAVSSPATATAGTPVSVTVTAQDAYGNTETGYLGTVNLTSTDPQAAALGSHGFGAGDAGTYVFSATLKTAGSQTVSAGDGAITGSAGPVTVSPGAVSTSASTVTGAPASVLADGATPVTVTVTLKDSYGNAEPSKTVSVGSTGSAVVSAATATNSSGVATFTVTDTAVESSTFTGTDTTDSVILPTTPSASFVAGPLATIQISPSSSTVAAGVSQVYGVTGSDAYGHSLGAQTATFGIVPDGACVNPTASCSATISGLHAVTATVSGHTSVASLTVSVGSGSGGTSTLTASPSTIVADGATASTITVRLKDTYGNNLTSGGATVVLSTTAGTLSAVTDNGNGTYSANLTATSAGSGTVSGTVNGASISTTAAVVFTSNDTTPPVLATATAQGGTGNLTPELQRDARRQLDPCDRRLRRPPEPVPRRGDQRDRERLVGDALARQLRRERRPRHDQLLRHGAEGSRRQPRADVPQPAGRDHRPGSSERPGAARVRASAPDQLRRHRVRRAAAPAAADQVRRLEPGRRLGPDRGRLDHAHGEPYGELGLDLGRAARRWDDDDPVGIRGLVLAAVQGDPGRRLHADGDDGRRVQPGPAGHGPLHPRPCAPGHRRPRQGRLGRVEHR